MTQPDALSTLFGSTLPGQQPTERELQLQDHIDRMEEALQRIMQWCGAYPVEIFPEPDLKKARELLKAGGLTLDAISASMARHVLDGVNAIAREGLDHGSPG